MNKEHHQSRKTTKGPSGAGARPARTPKVQRPSLAGERAEGEGMIAPAPRDEAAKKGSDLEGEGSYSAARRYDEGVERSVKKGDAEKLSKEAAEALDGPEGDELRKAEKAAKHGHSS
jgi:hypothetical protein